MSAKTKIIVLHMKEVILAGILSAILLLLLTLTALLLFHGQSSENSSGALQDNVQKNVIYRPGVYKTEVVLGGRSIDVETVLEQDRISSIRLVNQDEAITTMYPLLIPSMQHICDQVYETQSLEAVTIDPGTKYTSMVLLEAIRNCLEKGTP